LFDEMTGIASADLRPEEIDRLRPAVYRQNARESDETLYHKVHDAWTILPTGEPMFPADITSGVLYFIRNPLDVAVSFANHLNTGIDKTIAIMHNPAYTFCGRNDRLYNQLRQRLLTWSGHVKSWVDDSGYPVLVMRYEDMKASPVETFTRAVAFLGLSYNPSEIETALDRTSFARLKQQEEEKGFSEKSSGSTNFFRKGVVGDWRNVLTKEQVNRIVEGNYDTMKQYGYV